MASHKAASLGVLVVLATWAYLGAGGAQAQVAGKVAVVNINQIQAQYGELQAEQQQLEKWLAEQRRTTNMLLDFVFLSAEHFQEVVNLLKKDQRTPEEQQRLTELQGISLEKDKRFRALEANTNRTPQEQDEFNSLQDIYRARAKTVDEMWQGVLAQLNERRQTAVSGLMGKVRDAIKAEAEAQGLELVLDADAVLYGGVDITEAVLARLNAGQPAAAGGGGGGNGGG